MNGLKFGPKLISGDAMKIENIIKTAMVSVGTFIGWYFGRLDGFLYALIIFVVVDYLTGILCAIHDKNLSSEVGFKGISKKVLIFILVGIGNVIDITILQEGGSIRTAVIFFYLSNEGISIIENAAHLGLPIPEALKNVLNSLDKEKK